MHAFDKLGRDLKGGFNLIHEFGAKHLKVGKPAPLIHDRTTEKPANSPSCRHKPCPSGTPSEKIACRVSSTATEPAMRSSTWRPADAKSCSRRRRPVGIRGRRRAAGTYRVSTGMCWPRRIDRTAMSLRRPPTKELADQSAPTKSNSTPPS